MNNSNTTTGPAVYEALSLFRKGYNCAQVIMSVYGPRYGCDENLSLKVASSFGGGATRADRPCGAVTGALMVLGLEFGRGLNDDLRLRKICDQKADEFVSRFTGRYNTTLCGALRAQKGDLEPTIVNVNGEDHSYRGCAGFVAGAVIILEDLLREQVIENCED